MTDEQFAIVNAMIINDEGGWVLSDHPNDPDVATYGGMRWVTFNSWQKKQDEALIIKLFNFRRYAAENSEVLQKRIIMCYIDVFWKPLRLSELPAILRPVLFSCAVNRGTYVAVIILQEAYRRTMPNPQLIVDGVIGPKTIRAVLYAAGLNFLDIFIDEWIRDYINLVQSNSQAWHDYAVSYNIQPKYEEREPTTFRAVFLGGWFNRATRYRYN